MRGKDHASEPTARGVQSLLGGFRNHLEGHVDVALVDLRHSETGDACHGPVHCVLRRSSTQNIVVGIGLDCAHSVGWINVFDGQGLAFLLETCKDLVLEPKADIHVLQIHSRGAGQRVLATLRNDHHSIALGAHERLAMVQDLIEADLHLWHQADVHVSCGQGSLHCEETAALAWQLHEADAIGVARSLNIGRVYGVAGLCAGSAKAQGPFHHREVVVDGNGKSHTSAIVLLSIERREDLQDSPMGAIAPQREEVAHILGLEHRGRVRRSWIVSLVLKDGATMLVDVLYHLFRELEPIGGLHNAIEAVHDAEDARHPVAAQADRNLADGHVQAWADGPAGHDRSATARLRRVEVQELTWTSSEELVVGLALSRGVHSLRGAHGLQGVGAVIKEAR
mmetsp:Transcript_86647/g.185656  ORF Transcript_86647/g.185656 Transcript_86647/m.185656 type:complete len:395 (-) Transcript_86647:349-1533(-)